MLTIGFVTGTEPGKWFRRYEQLEGARLSTSPAPDPFTLLAAGEADAVLMRLPDARVGEEHHVVRLYDEARGVAVPKDSVYAEVGEEVSPEDIADEHLNHDFYRDPDVDALRAALQVVAANVGVAVAPLPLLKTLSKKQVVPLPLDAVDAGTSTEIALVWLKSRDADDVQDFVGITKGRTPRSSRGTAKNEKSKSSRVARNRKKHRHTR